MGYNKKMVHIQSKRFSIEAIGFGTYRVPPGDEAYKAVTEALEVGYRSIDTAKYYDNEQDVGRAVRDAKLQESVQITTKLWNDEQGYDAALSAGRRSRDYLGVESIDLFLVHWPGENKFIETWKAFEKLKSEGTVKDIGVSNFNARHLEALREAGLATPVINQIEMNPLFTQAELRRYCAEHDIIIEAWRPIMGGKIAKLDAIQDIATRHGKSLAQVALRWSVQRGCRVLPKSTHRQRMVENLNIFDFELSEEELAAIDAMNVDYRSGPDPEAFLF